MARKLPGRELCALVAGSGFINIDMDGNASLKRCIDGCRCSAHVDCCKPACITVGENVDWLIQAFCGGDAFNDLQSVAANGCVECNVFIGNQRCMGKGFGCALARRDVAQDISHAIKRPLQIDRCWPGSM